MLNKRHYVGSTDLPAVQNSVPVFDCTDAAVYGFDQIAEAENCYRDIRQKIMQGHP